MTYIETLSVHPSVFIDKKESKIDPSSFFLSQLPSFLSLLLLLTDWLVSHWHWRYTSIYQILSRWLYLRGKWFPVEYNFRILQVNPLL